MPKRYILTGAPGAGKTSVLRLLGERGWSVVDEAATAVIAREQAGGVDKPWESTDFVDKIVAVQRQRQQAAVSAEVQVQFYDRSPFCTLALAQYLRHPVSPALATEIARLIEELVYEPAVFFVRPIGVVTPTPARRISYQDSLVFEDVHETVYRTHGFQMIDVDTGTIEQRATAIEAWVQNR